MACTSRLVAMAERVAQALCVLADPVANISVARAYDFDFLSPDLWKDNPDLQADFEGRLVRVFTVGQVHEGAFTRAHDDNRYRVGVIVLERYDGPEPVPPVDWLDERVAWVESQVYDYLGDARNPVIEDGETFAQAQEWVAVYNPALLRQHKVFRSEVLVTFRRIEIVRPAKR